MNIKKKIQQWIAQFHKKKKLDEQRMEEEESVDKNPRKKRYHGIIKESDMRYGYHRDLYRPTGIVSILAMILVLCLLILIIFHYLPFPAR